MEDGLPGVPGQYVLNAVVPDGHIGTGRVTTLHQVLEGKIVRDQMFSGIGAKTSLARVNHCSTTHFSIEWCSRRHDKSLIISTLLHVNESYTVLLKDLDFFLHHVVCYGKSLHHAMLKCVVIQGNKQLH